MLKLPIPAVPAAFGVWLCLATPPSQLQTSFLPLAASVAALDSAAPPSAAPADYPVQHTQILGGQGGAAYTIRCPAGSVLTGFTPRTGYWLDQVRIRCRQVKSDGTLGASTDPTAIAGGAGGTPQDLRQCSAGKVIAAAVVSYGSYVHHFTAHCRPWKAATREFDPFGGLEYVNVSGALVQRGPQENGVSCTRSSQPVVGIRGREGAYLDAIGFICDEP